MSTKSGLMNPALQDEFSSYLKSRNHTLATTAAYKRAVTHFQHWLYAEPSFHCAINPQSIRSFLEDHLPQCTCPSPGHKSIGTVRGALNNLLLMLDQSRYHLVPEKASPENEGILLEFDTYLDTVCGLEESTRRCRCRFAKEFLVALFGSQPPEISLISVEKVFDFVTSRAAEYKPTSVHAITVSIRSFLKYLQFRGHCTTSLIDSIPRVPNWTMARLPENLDDGQVQQFLGSFDRSTAIGKRDYAIARCFIDLGLRCCEVSSIQLEDLDWRGSTLKLLRTKSRKKVELPLPQEMGAALVEYLRYGRPITKARAVFVYHRAPLGKGIKKTTVRGAMRRGFVRAGLPWSGPHVLRHTVATYMLQGGATLEEIANVLGHKSIDTTMIYTKVDLTTLSKVAQPWPGRSK